PRPAVAALPRYSTAAEAGRVRWRASSNESSVPPTPAVVAAIADAAGRVNRYPSLLGEELAGDIARRLGVAPSQVVVGGGSIALLQQALAAYTGHGTEVVFGWRSYEAYPILVGAAGARAVPVPLDADATHDLEAMLAAITPETAAIIVCNPNNPTGTEVGGVALRAFLDRVPSDVLVLLDEAYREFGAGETDGVELLPRHPNLVVLRTFSKAYGLAGLRVGYLVASDAIADDVRAGALPFGVSLVAGAAARVAWADETHVDEIVRTVTDSRARLQAALAERGIPTPASGANFVWLPVGEDAPALERLCVEQGVSVRAFAGEGVRVTVGDPDAEDAVLRAVDAYLAAGPSLIGGATRDD
ncbi:histidinol-phosphate transaminase, partial [Patulibacter sp. S7RM1-6]